MKPNGNYNYMYREMFLKIVFYYQKYICSYISDRVYFPVVNG